MEVEARVDLQAKPSSFSFPLRPQECSAGVALASNGDVESCETSVVRKIKKAVECAISLPSALQNLTESVGTINGEETPTSETTAALKVQKVYRSYRTRRKLADSAVVAEELWWQALDFVRLNHSTVSFFNFTKPESAAARWNRISLNASKVGKGLSKDVKALKLAFQHWIEAIDPRHRYGHSLHYYYEEWCKTDVDQPFFYWLDIGDGREVDLEECPRSKLRKQCIKYLGPQEREHYEYIVVDGKIVHKQTGKLLDTLKGSEGAKWIFVMSAWKKLYAGEKKKGKFHHSSFLAGGATLAAGRLVAENGVLKSISAYSGHYRPTDENLGCLVTFLKETGVNLDNVQVHHPEGSGSFEDSISFKKDSVVAVLQGSEPSRLESRNEVLQDQPSEPAAVTRNESTEAAPAESGSISQTTSSGSLPSPRPEVPRKTILERMNSKKTARSYQLGNQLSLKWCTGAGPRIGCIADYPVELREQALEFVNLSPRNPLTPTSFRQLAGHLPSPRPRVMQSPRPTMVQ